MSDKMQVTHSLLVREPQGLACACKDWPSCKRRSCFFSPARGASPRGYALTFLRYVCCNERGALAFERDRLAQFWALADQRSSRTLQLAGVCKTPILHWKNPSPQAVWVIHEFLKITTMKGCRNHAVGNANLSIQSASSSSSARHSQP